MTATRTLMHGRLAVCGNKGVTNTNKKSNKISARKQIASTIGPAIKAAVAAGLRAGGAGLGGYLGGPAGAGVGHDVGAWVSQLIGSGDYEVRQNSIYSKGHAGVPTFHNHSRSIRIQHREYLGDITGSTAFTSASYAINPGLASSFPWLASIATNFQQYKFHGLVFCFNSTSADALNSTNTALGTLIMATQYNVNRDNFTSKLEMEGYEFSCSSRPSSSLMHPIECDPSETPLKEMYIRIGAVENEDKRLYDLGNFQVATVGMQAAANIGELWVTYDVEFFKPRIPPGGSVPGLFSRIENGPFTGSDVLGSIQTVPKGNLGVQIQSNGANFNRIFFPASISTGKFLVVVGWIGGVSALNAVVNPTLTNLTLVTDLNLSTSGQLYYPGGATTTRQNYVAYVTVNQYSAAGSFLEFPALTLPATPQAVDIMVISMPASDVFV